MAKSYDYCTAPGSQHGTMICAACQKPIESGQYRVRDAGDRYVTHHRACSADDQRWAALDHEVAEQNRLHAEMVAEAKAFYAKWGFSDLSDLVSCQQVPA